MKNKKNDMSLRNTRKSSPKKRKGNNLLKPKTEKEVVVFTFRLMCTKIKSF